MKNRHIFFPLVLLLILTVTACKRFDEGPDFSIWSVKNRLVNTWEWSYALENGTNRTGELEGTTIEFTDNNVVKICTGDDPCQEGNWSLISKKQKLQLIFDQEAVAYDILMLRKNEIWLVFTNDTQDIRWELVRAD